ncbi:MAG TPA: hypothetical protein VGE35_03825 [Candidatus Paceibacterota bacterium]
MNPPSQKVIDSFRAALKIISILFTHRNRSGRSRLTTLDPNLLDSISEQITAENLLDSVPIITAFLKSIGEPQKEEDKADDLDDLGRLIQHVKGARSMIIHFGPEQQNVDLANALLGLDEYLSDRHAKLKRLAANA